MQYAAILFFTSFSIFFQNILQQSLATFCHIFPGSLKIPCIPRICHISAAAGKGHHLKYFSLRISASDPLYIADIPFIHTNKIIIPIIIRPGHLSRMMPLTSYSRLSKLRPCSTMNRVTDLFRGCGSG